MIFFPRYMKRVVKFSTNWTKWPQRTRVLLSLFLHAHCKRTAKKLGLASNGISWFIKSVCYFNRANMETWTISCNFCGQIAYTEFRQTNLMKPLFSKSRKKVMFAHHHGEAMISVFSCLYTIFYIEEQTPFYGNCTERACRNIKPPKKLSQQCDS